MRASRTSAFAGAGFGVAIAAAAIAASLLWRLAPMPGGRWPAVHLLTLGAVTPLIATFMPRFASALLHAPPSRRSGNELWVAVIAAGAALVIAGRIAGRSALVAIGAAAMAVAIAWLYWSLRRARRRSLPARFGFVVRAYERACGAFLHGAVLGASLGTGVISGSWYAPARAAHIQFMILGWVGITLLATLVTFGPAVMRSRMEDGADAVAARALRRAATAAMAGAHLLVLSGLGNAAGTAARVAAAAAFAIFAAESVRVCTPVVRAARRAAAPSAGLLVPLSCAGFVLAAALTAAGAAFGAPRVLDAAIVAFLTAAFLPAIIASISHVLPLIAGDDACERRVIGDVLATLPRLRAATLAAGALLVTAAALTSSGSTVDRVGWVLVAAGAGATVPIVAVAFGAARGPRERAGSC